MAMPDGCTQTQKGTDATESVDPQFKPGDKVRVMWMDIEVEATIVERDRSGHTRRNFYRLLIEGVKGHPAYEDCEMTRV